MFADLPPLAIVAGTARAPDLVAFARTHGYGPLDLIQIIEDLN